MSIHSPSEKLSEGETAPDTEQRIREHAYMLWEGEGRQEGRADYTGIALAKLSTMKPNLLSLLHNRRETATSSTP